MERSFDTSPFETPPPLPSEVTAEETPVDVTDDMILEVRAEPFSELMDQLSQLERSKLDGRGKNMKSWLLASAFVVATGVVAMMERFSDEGNVEAKAYAAKILNTEKEQGNREQVKTQVREEENKKETEKTDEYARVLKKIRQNPNFALNAMKDIAKMPDGLELMVEAAKEDPFLFGSFWPRVAEFFPNYEPIIEATLIVQPTALLDSDSSDLVKDVVKASTNPVIKKIREILLLQLSSMEKTKLLALLDPLLKGMSVEQACQIIADEHRFVETLIDVSALPDHLAGFSLNEILKHSFRPQIDKMNHLHGKPPEIRFKIIQEMSVRELSAMLFVDGGGVEDYDNPSAYPSTYQGVFKLLLKRMQEQGTSGDVLLAQMGQSQQEKFLSMAVQRGRFGDFLSTMSPEAQMVFLQTIFETIGTKENVAGAGGIASDILRQTKNPEHLAIITQIVRERFLQAKKDDPKLYTVYGALSLLIDANASWIPVGERSEYRLEDFSTLDLSKLENGNGEIIERYYFFHNNEDKKDKDGENSFAHFLRSYENRPGCKIEKKDGYVVISLKGGKRPIKIFANDPSKAQNTEDQTDPVEEAMQKEGLSATAVFLRGHIFHLNGVVDQLPSTMQFLFIGMCGGYADVDNIMQKYGNIQVISTTDTATMHINDAMSRSLEIDFANQDQLNWSEYNVQMQRKIGNADEFSFYRLPHENNYPMFKALVDNVSETEEADRLASTL